MITPETEPKHIVLLDEAGETRRLPYRQAVGLVSRQRARWASADEAAAYEAAQDVQTSAQEFEPEPDVYTPTPTAGPADDDTDGPDLSDGLTITDTLAAVDAGTLSARDAYEHEAAKDNPRVTLLDRLLPHLTNDDTEG